MLPGCTELLSLETAQSLLLLTPFWSDSKFLISDYKGLDD